jgi:hypothetical protein
MPEGCGAFVEHSAFGIGPIGHSALRHWPLGIGIRPFGLEHCALCLEH